MSISSEVSFVLRCLNNYDAFLSSKVKLLKNFENNIDNTTKGKEPLSGEDNRNFHKEVMDFVKDEYDSYDDDIDPLITVFKEKMKVVRANKTDPIITDCMMSFNSLYNDFKDLNKKYDDMLEVVDKEIDILKIKENPPRQFGYIKLRSIVSKYNQLTKYCFDNISFILNREEKEE